MLIIPFMVLYLPFVGLQGYPSAWRAPSVALHSQEVGPSALADDDADLCPRPARGPLPPAVLDCADLGCGDQDPPSSCALDDPA